MGFEHDTFISPFTWRYGSPEMREIWSETHKRLSLRRVWVALARAEMKAGIITLEQFNDIDAHKEDIDIERASEIEADIKHDLMAEIKTYAEQCKIGGGAIHLGATSMDILDNADAVRQSEALGVIESRLVELLGAFADKIGQYAATPSMAFTHLQSAEPTTVGYRLSQYAQDLLDDLKQLDSLKIKGKGIKGAVGTAASFSLLLSGSGSSLSAADLEKEVMDELGIEAFSAATQVYPRKQDLRLMQVLSSIACSLSKFAFDLRLMQSSGIAEWSESFSAHQVGSSAMPFKRNPINAEKTDSLCRYIKSLESNAWDNAALSALERTLDDSANRRLFIPEAFLALDECLITSIRLIRGMNVHSDGIQRNLSSFGVFAATEKLLMELGSRGADRQKMHEVIRASSLEAWSAVQRGEKNPLVGLLSSSAEITAYIPADEVRQILDASDYTGRASEIALRIKARIDQI